MPFHLNQLIENIIPPINIGLTNERLQEITLQFNSKIEMVEDEYCLNGKRLKSDLIIKPMAVFRHRHFSTRAVASTNHN